MPSLRVTTASESAARDAAAIAAGTPSRALMQRAGAAAAAELVRQAGRRVHDGVVVLAGPGNNGGDGWVVARALAACGISVGVEQCGELRTEDSRFERSLAEPLMSRQLPPRPGAVVDALLGTGSRGAPRDEIAAAIERIETLRRSGAMVASLDLPSGLDATTGDATLAVRADLTLTFGSAKRGQLVRRDLVGRLIVLDIGLGAAGDDDGAPTLMSASSARASLPEIPADAHKGTRKRLVIVGGQLGMAGAAMLAADAAMRSGIGMVRLLVAEDSLPIVQSAAPFALAARWPDDDDEMRAAIGEWAHAVLLGPGLGDTPGTRALVERVLGAWRGPTLLDADALNVFRGDPQSLGGLLATRPALLTPHPVELGRLTGTAVERVLAERFEIGREVARVTGAAVLLKGVPTVITSPTGERYVSASGTPALAAAGSGDLLSGIAATLLAQLDDPAIAGACAAWVHGRAAEIACEGRPVRGVALSEVVHALPRAWRIESPPPRPPVLADLPPARADE